MGYYFNFLAISLGWNLLLCDATVTVSLINSAYGVDSLECGSDGIVNCRINPHTDFINWFVNDTHYATCSPGCFKSPSFPRTYPTTYDATNEVFSLTIESATFNDSSTSFKCDDGSLSGEITIKVVPAYSENTTSIIDTDGGKQVEFTTACVKLGVNFDWFTVKTDNSERKIYNQKQHKMTNASVCSVDSKCGRDGTAKVSSIITIPTVLHGEKRYLEVDVIYNNPYEKKRFRFDEPFIFKVSKCKLSCCCIIFLIYLARWIQHVTSYCAGSLLYTSYQIDITAKIIFISILTCIPLIGSCFAIILLCTLLCKQLSKDIKTSCVVFGKVLLGYLPLLGTFYTTFILFWELKEHFSWKRRLLFMLCWICDITIIVLMILTCTDEIEVPCLLYAVYALGCLVFSWMNFVCLAECLQKQAEINEDGIEPLLCDLCKQLKNESKAELLCLYCNTVLCEKCIEGHLKGHTKQRKKTGYGQKLKKSNKIGNEPKILCDSCKQLMKESKAELECFDCNTILCEKCTQEHLKRHAALKRKTSHVQIQNENIKIDNGPKLLCDLCKKSKAELYCIDCVKILCEKCTQEHLKEHIAQNICECETWKMNNKIDHEPELLCDSCKKLKKESKAVLKCIDCDTILCEKCTQEHLNGQTQNENSNTGDKPDLQCDSCEQTQIKSKAEIKCFDCNEVLCVECTEDHLKRHNQMRKDPSYGQTSNNINRIPDIFVCSTCDNIVESYCLSCQQYLCKACITDHAVHRVLRHCQQEAGKTQIEIFCKFCQNKSKKADAKYYSRGDKSFVCEKCKPTKRLKNTIAINDSSWQCKRCEDNDDHTIHPVECHCIIYNENMCTVCFEKNRKQSLLLHKPIDDKKIRHTSVCALHSVSGLPVTQHFKSKTVRKESSDVYCYVCDEYLCTRCFYLHISLEQLWKQQRFDKEFKKTILEQVKQDKLCEQKTEDQLWELEQFDEKHTAEQVKQEHIIVVICEQKTEVLLRRKKNVPVQWIFNGCFPVLGIFATIHMLRSIKEKNKN